MSEHADNSDQQGPERATFIPRLIRERRPSAVWRAEVEYLQMGDRRVAADVDGAIACLAEWLTSLRVHDTAQ